MPATSTPEIPYVGRFAPSPTGPIHMGTLVSAMASYLDARQHQGHWLLRIEDIDRPREVAGAAEAIILFLERAGFVWHKPVVYQSKRDTLYREILQRLVEMDSVYGCDCSRSQTSGGIYSGHCRNLKKSFEGDKAIRVISQDIDIIFTDRVRGLISHPLQKQTGDFIIRRRDGLFAYQLAVVIDDAESGVNQVVRGMDLLDSTPRQIYLQQLLGLQTPTYAHTPLIMGHDGKKLSKSLPGGNILQPDQRTLVQAWNLLQPATPASADFDTLDNFWRWAIQHWQLKQATRDRFYD